MIASTDTAIIGAGPYGLCLSAYLTGAGVPHQILGDPMHAWRNYTPPGMMMRSEPFAASLYAPKEGYSIEAYCRSRGYPYKPVGMLLPRELFVEYAMWFQSQLVSHVRNVEVTDLQRRGEHFQLTLNDGGTLLARRVVIAMGLKGFAFVPPALRHMPKPAVLHSSEFGALDWARQKDIAIVGGGQSALGLAALLLDIGAARVRVIVRDEELTWYANPVEARGLISRILSPEGGLGRGWPAHIISEYPFVFRLLSRERRARYVATAWGPSGAWWLRDRVLGKVEVLLNSQISRAQMIGDRVGLHLVHGKDESSDITAEHLIVATGFRVDMARHAFLSTDIVDGLRLTDGAPDLTRNFETHMAGLYVVGPAAATSFGPVMRFVYGAKYAAPHLAAHIARRFAGESQAQPVAQELADAETGATVQGSSLFAAPASNLEGAFNPDARQVR